MTADLAQLKGQVTVLWRAILAFPPKRRIEVRTTTPLLYFVVAMLRLERSLAADGVLLAA
jgi:hypothetical protein